MSGQIFKLIFFLILSPLFLFSPAILKAQDIRSYSYLPAPHKFYFNIKGLYQTQRLETDKGNNDDQVVNKKAAKSIFELGYSWSKHYTSSIEWGHYFYDKTQSSYGTENRSYRGLHFEKKSTWATEWRFNLFRRLDENFLGAPMRDLIFSYSPKRPSKFVNVGRKNAHEFNGGLRFGATDQYFDAIGLFYVGYEFDAEQRRVEDNNLEKSDPHTFLGMRFDGQFNFYGPLSLGALGGIERETDYVTHKPTGNDKTVKSWKYTYGGEFAFIGSDTLRASFSFIQERLKYYILRPGDDDKVTGINTYYVLSVKKEI